ncbi:MAG: hypothetical protein ACTH0V_00385 [Microbacteriaceae bacterium]
MRPHERTSGAPHPTLTRDQREGESPDVMYGAYRYLDRLFAEQRPHRRDEIAALDVSQLSPRVRYLLRHLLILQRRYAQVLAEFPNLRPLHDERGMVLDRPIVLADPPRHSWAYFREKGIWF